MTEDIQVIELTAQEPSGVNRRGFPLTVGLPFAPGILPDEHRLTLTDSRGAVQPLQTRVLERHGEGSVRWLLLDYQSDFVPFAPSHHLLRLDGGGGRPMPHQGVRLQGEGDRLVISNGVLRFQVRRDRCHLLQNVEHEGRRVTTGGLDFIIEMDRDKRFTTTDDTEARFEIEETGPLRVVLRWDGTHRARNGDQHLDFTVRLSVWDGCPFVRVDHVFTNRLDSDVTPMRSLVARLPIEIGGDIRSASGLGQRRATPIVSQVPLLVAQDTLKQARVVLPDGDIQRYPNNVSAGWVDVSGDTCGATLVGKTFWQNYPKAIHADGSTIEYHLLPAQKEPYQLPRGIAKTHTFFLRFHIPSTDVQDIADIASSLQRWPMPVAPSQYYQASGQLWDYFPYYPKQYPRLESALRSLAEPDQPALREGEARTYGWKHYGDFIYRKLSYSGEDLDAPDTYFMNNEYDTSHVLTMLFLRTGDVARWWVAEAHALHTMDIDTCHHAVEGRFIGDPQRDPHIMQGCQYTHCYQHVGGAQTPGVKPEQYRPAGGSHTFAEGLFDYYHLTGDRRALDIGVGYARSLAHMAPIHRWGMGRGSGWALLVMGGAYMARPDDEIRRGAEYFVQATRDDQDAGRGVSMQRGDGGEWAEQKVHRCIRGLIKWHQATGDQTTRQLILDLMNAYINVGLLEEGLPYSHSWPELYRPLHPEQGYGQLEGFAYAYDLTGDQRFIAAGIPILCGVIEWISHPFYQGYNGYFHRQLRGPFRFMAIAHEQGILKNIPGAGSWLANENPDRR